MTSASQCLDTFNVCTDQNQVRKLSWQAERERAAGTHPEPGIQMAGGTGALADIRLHPV